MINIVGVQMMDVLAFQADTDRGDSRRCEITFYLTNGQEVFMQGVAPDVVSNFMEEWRGSTFTEGC